MPYFFQTIFCLTRYELYTLQIQVKTTPHPPSLKDLMKRNNAT